MITMKDILDDKNPILREKSVEVPLPLCDEDRELLKSMHEYLVNSQDKEIAEKYGLQPSAGIAAVQLGVLKKMCAILLYIRDEEGNITRTITYALANPRIISCTKEMAYLKTGEACLSVKEEHRGYVYRHERVTVEGYDLLTDSNVSIIAKGYLAMTLQHEIDHFDGILFYDYIDKEYPKLPIFHRTSLKIPAFLMPSFWHSFYTYLKSTCIYKVR